MNHPPVVVLGPTASGKSDVAMAAALTVPGTEVVAVDAMQVYRGMDIGTAKPTASDRAAVPHHGLDLVEPAAPFGVTDFVAAFDEAIDTIAERGGRPLLVAGTGLYLTAVLDPQHRAFAGQRGTHEPVDVAREHLGRTLRRARLVGARQRVAAAGRRELTHRRRQPVLILAHRAIGAVRAARIVSTSRDLPVEVVRELGAVLGAHVGPGMVAVCVSPRP